MQDFAVARRAMVDCQLRPQGVTDRAVLAAMGHVERERFVPESARDFAYFDRPLKIAEGRSMMPPAALGRLLSEVAPAAGEKALIVGAGTGYSSALLSAMGLDVTAIESDDSLLASATTTGANIAKAELATGYAKGAPFDVILIDGAVEQLPDGLVSQLAEGGRIALARIDRGVSRLVVGRKVHGSVGMTTVADADVAPLPGFERPKAFTF